MVTTSCIRIRLRTGWRCGTAAKGGGSETIRHEDAGRPRMSMRKARYCTSRSMTGTMRRNTHTHPIAPTSPEPLKRRPAPISWERALFLSRGRSVPLLSWGRNSHRRTRRLGRSIWPEKELAFRHYPGAAVSLNAVGRVPASHAPTAAAATLPRVLRSCVEPSIQDHPVSRPSTVRRLEAMTAPQAVPRSSHGQHRGNACRMR